MNYKTLCYSDPLKAKYFQYSLGLLDTGNTEPLHDNGLFLKIVAVIDRMTPDEVGRKVGAAHLLYLHKNEFDLMDLADPHKLEMIAYMALTQNPEDDNEATVEWYTSLSQTLEPGGGRDSQGHYESLAHTIVGVGDYLWKMEVLNLQHLVINLFSLLNEKEVEWAYQSGTTLETKNNELLDVISKYAMVLNELKSHTVSSDGSK